MEGSLCEVAAVRLDAGFPDEELLSGLEARGIPYVARIRNNPVLDRMAAPHLKRPGGGRHCGGVGCAQADGSVSSWFLWAPPLLQAGSSWG